MSRLMPFRVLMVDDPEDFVFLGVEPVIAPLVLNPEQDEQRAGQSDSQTGDVDGGKDLLLFQVPDKPDRVTQ